MGSGTNAMFRTYRWGQAPTQCLTINKLMSVQKSYNYKGETYYRRCLMAEEQLTPQQLEVISLIKQRVDIREVPINFQNNNKAFEVYFSDQDSQQQNAVILLNEHGKISLYDSVDDVQATLGKAFQIRAWDRKKCVDFCKAIDLPIRLLERQPVLVKKLNEFFMEANGPQEDFTQGVESKNPTINPRS